MSINITDSFYLINTIKQYAGEVPTSQRVTPEQNVFNTTLLEIFSGLKWQRGDALDVDNAFQKVPTQPNWGKIWFQRDLQVLAKLDTGALRFMRGKPVLPCAEECASKVAQLLQIPEVPEAIVIPEAQVDRPEYARFKPYMLCFMNSGVERRCPVTFTFQKLVEGRVLPSSKQQWHTWKSSTPTISLASYQRAYLFAWLIGKGDAFFGNTLHDPKSGALYEIDNEVIGKPVYPGNGVLHRFASLKSAPISEDILKAILDVDPQKLYQLLKSYDKKNAFIIRLWEKEQFTKPNGKYTKDLPDTCKRVNKGTYQRFVVIQTAVRTIQAKEEVVTLRKVEEALEQALDRYDLDQAIRHKEEEEAFGTSS